MAGDLRHGRRGFSRGLTGPDNTVTEIVIAGGQSLSLGPNMGSKASPSGTLWRDVYDGTAQPKAGYLTGLKRADGVAVANVANPLLQAYDKTVDAAGIAPAVVLTSLPVGSVIATGLIRDGLAAETLFQFHDAGGQSILNLDADPATGDNGTTLYDNVEHWTKNAARLVRAAGKTPLVRRQHLNQGEADVSWARGQWLAAARKTIDDRNAQIMRLTGQSIVPRLFLEQTGGYMMNTATNLHQCKLDQLDLVRERNGILTTPLYPFMVDNSDDKGVHKTALGHLEFSETILWAIAEVEAGRFWNILPPAGVQRAGDVISIPLPMRGDEALMAEAAGKYTGFGGDPDNLGFEVIGGGAITNVALSGGSVVLTVSGTVTGIRYAMQRTATDYRALTDADKQGYTAHRGMLRTTLTKKVTTGGQALVLKRWVPSFEYASKDGASFSSA